MSRPTIRLRWSLRARSVCARRCRLGDRRVGVEQMLHRVGAIGPAYRLFHRRLESGRLRARRPPRRPAAQPRSRSDSAGRRARSARASCADGARVRGDEAREARLERASRPSSSVSGPSLASRTCQRAARRQRARASARPERRQRARAARDSGAPPRARSPAGRRSCGSSPSVVGLEHLAVRVHERAVGPARERRCSSTARRGGPATAAAASTRRTQGTRSSARAHLRRDRA